jgi:hypothetical protein
LDFYGGAIAAYSFRQLRTGHTTAVVRVRRSSDNAEADFLAKEVTDGTLASWVGAGNDGYVRTFYDQSGNGRNMGQATSTRQPKLVASGAVILQDNLPTLEFTNSRGDLLNTGTVFTAGPPLDAYLVARFRAFSGGGGIRGLLNSSAASSAACLRESFGTLEMASGTNLSIGSSASVVSTNRFVWNPYFDTSTSSSLRRNGSLVGSAGNAGTNTISGLALATDAQIANRSGDVNIQEAVFYGAQQARRADIVANINKHFAVY